MEFGLCVDTTITTCTLVHCEEELGWDRTGRFREQPRGVREPSIETPSVQLNAPVYGVG